MKQANIVLFSHLPKSNKYNIIFWLIFTIPLNYQVALYLPELGELIFQEHVVHKEVAVIKQQTFLLKAALKVILLNFFCVQLILFFISHFNLLHFLAKCKSLENFLFKTILPLSNMQIALTEQNFFHPPLNCLPKVDCLMFHWISAKLITIDEALLTHIFVKSSYKTYF